MVKAVVGANWGDEGKGKITDMLAEKADIIIRLRRYRERAALCSRIWTRPLTMRRWGKMCT